MAHAKPVDSIKVHGVSDEITTCEHCGRENLKATVAISVDGGEVVNFGRSCAATALKVGRASINAAVREFEKTERTAERAEKEAAHAKEFAAWTSFLAPRGDSISEACHALGGFGAARAAFRAAQGDAS